MSGIQWIRDNYAVPAKVGMVVGYSGDDRPRTGIITGTRGPHLLIRLDGSVHSRPFHPTWEIEYPISTPQPNVDEGDGK